jgi:tRNA(adenine34) deaminase
MVVASGHNETVLRGSPLAHAEMVCLERGAQSLGAWRLLYCTLYVTLEPCPMCAGAALQSRLKRLVYGARQPR